jgi:putative (di)nucleoside polyphosphate hydrolase
MSAQYRPCVGVALFNAKGEVFIGRRRRKRSSDHIEEGHEWQMPQGGIDEGESAVDAAVRELREETNVGSVSLLAESTQWLSYDFPADVINQRWGGRYKGQRQKWFAFRFEGTDSDINIHAPAGGHKPEFDQWRWEQLARTPELIIPFKRQVYVAVAKEFARFALAQ